MLLRFQASNHRSILEPVELSMIAVDEDRPPVRSFELLNEQVLTVSGIYGPNASGKSNVIEALAWLASAVGQSLRAWDETIPRDPFKFGGGPQLPSTYEVEMMSDNVRYAYHLQVTDSEVLSESLISYPKRQPRTLFEREGREISFRRGLENTTGARELLTPTTLALSAIMRFKEPDIQPFGRDLRSIMGLGLRRGRVSLSLPYSATASIFQEDDLDTPQEVRDSVLALLRFADLGIDDIQMVPDGTLQTDALSERRKLMLLHRAAGQEIPFDLDEESGGTQTWFRLIGPALSALRGGCILIFDEIDASLHPQLSARLLELFQDPDTNPHGAQLIFTTHDTSLLNLLNRDEVWLTEKSDAGSTTLTALAEFGGDRVRRSLNLERAYLHGRFGAVPDLDMASLRRALGFTTDDAR